MEKRALIGMSLGELQEVVATLSLPRFTAKQIADWLYRKGVTDIAEMTNLSLKAREALAESYTVGRVAPSLITTSRDGTRKMLFEYATGAVEVAYIPDGGGRNTLCVSCQMGCKMGCRFCMTGRMGFHGNLSAAELINQVLSVPGSSELTNIVFMGMGEPMDNLEVVLRTVEILTSSYGLAWSPRRITVSTVGLPATERFLRSCDAHLAVSLHTPFAEERTQMMPVERAYPVADLIKMLRNYDWHGQRRLTFEYTLFEGLNDSQRHADELVRLLSGLICRVNLIAFNSIPGDEFRSTNRQRMEWFRDRLNAKGVTATIRESKGQDIDAACGLLSVNAKGR